MLVLVILVSLLVSPASAFETFPEAELVAFEAEVETETKKGMRYPLEKFYISQDFWFLHPAIDLVAPRGTPVYPVMAGQVIKVEYSPWGYGNQIVIDHGNKLKSRYAHLAQIEVQENEAVNQETVLGQVGATGFATGNHLHLEIIDKGQLINPKSYL